MTTTGTAEITCPVPTGDGFGFSPTAYWTAATDVVLADGGPLGTQITWRHLLQRLDFTIYDRLVATLECTPPDPATPNVFWSNGLLDIQGRVTEAVVQPWEERIHNRPLEFDSLVGAWCIAAYPNGRTVFWVYSNGNVRCRRVIETWYAQPRATNMPYTGLEQLAHIDADGRITVTQLSEKIVASPIVIGAPAPTGAGLGYKTAAAGTIEGVVPVPVFEWVALRAAVAGEIAGDVPIPTGQVAGVRSARATAVEGAVPVPTSDPVSGWRTAATAAIAGTVPVPAVAGGDFARVVVADEIAGAVPTPDIETATGAHVTVAAEIAGDVPVPAPDPIRGTRIGVADGIEGTVDVPTGAGDAVRIGVGNGDIVALEPCTEPDGIAIHDVTELQAMQNDLTADYYLANDIDASETATWNDGAGFEPVGTDTDRFTGSLDGRDFVVTGLIVNRPSLNRAGPFGVLGATGVIKNVGLEGGAITGGGGNIGGLVGYNYGTISSCYTTGAVTGSYTAVGGLVGYNQSGSAITNCYATGTVTGGSSVGGLVGINKGAISSSHAAGDVINNGEYGTYFGGLIGWNYGGGAVSSCYASGDVTSISWGIGGLSGKNAGSITTCYASGNVSTTATSGRIGGLVGQNDDIFAESGGLISDCYSIGTVTGEDAVGGLVGTRTAGTIARSYSSGAVVATTENPEHVGGLLGRDDGGTDSDCYWDIESSGQSESEGTATGKTTAEMQQQATFDGWDFDTVWSIESGEYPTLQALESESSESPPCVEMDASGIRTGTGAAQITVPIPTATAAGLRTGQLVAIVGTVDAPSIDMASIKTTFGAGDITAPLPVLYIRAENPAQAQTALYRVVAITRDPRGPYQRLTLEAIERPIDR